MSATEAGDRSWDPGICRERGWERQPEPLSAGGTRRGSAPRAPGRGLLSHALPRGRAESRRTLRSPLICPKTFNYTRRFFCFLFLSPPTFFSKVEQPSRTKARAYRTTSPQLSRGLFAKASAAENGQRKELALVPPCAFDTFSQHHARRGARSGKRRGGSRLFVSEGDFRAGSQSA